MKTRSRFSTLARDEYEWRMTNGEYRQCAKVCVTHQTQKAWNLPSSPRTAAGVSQNLCGRGKTAQARSTMESRELSRFQVCSGADHKCVRARAFSTEQLGQTAGFSGEFHLNVFPPASQKETELGVWFPGIGFVGLQESISSYSTFISTLISVYAQRY